MSAPTDALVLKYYDYLLAKSDGFYNEYYRYFAIREGAKGRWSHAARLFEIAARYGDKYSQHRLSLLYWHGVGVARDPVVAYIWADLAAERRYRSLIAIREKMWMQLSPDQQARVPSEGQSFYARYGDAVAMKKFGGIFARQGFVHNTYVAQNGRGRIDRLNARKYLQQEAAGWNRVTVTVGDVETTGAQDQTPAEQAKDGDKTP